MLVISMIMTGDGIWEAHVARWARLVAKVAVAALVAPLAACTGGQSARWLPATAGAGPTPDRDMAAVWAALTETTSKPYHSINRVETVDEAGKRDAWGIEVAADGPAGRFRINDWSDGNGDDQFLVGNTYLMTGASPGRWTRLDVGRLKTEGSLKAYIDTQTTVWQLIGMVRAAPAPGGYLCDVDLNLATADPRNSSRAVGLKRQLTTGDRHTVKLRFDTRGRVAQLSFTQDVPDAAGKHVLHISEDITFSQFGNPINLQVPKEADIRDGTKADYDLANTVATGS